MFIYPLCNRINQKWSHSLHLVWRHQIWFVPSHKQVQEFDCAMNLFFPITLPHTQMTQFPTNLSVIQSYVFIIIHNTHACITISYERANLFDQHICLYPDDFACLCNVVPSYTRIYDKFYAYMFTKAELLIPKILILLKQFT